MIVLKEIKDSIDKLKLEIQFLRSDVERLKKEIENFENKEHIVSISVNNKPVGTRGPIG